MQSLDRTAAHRQVRPRCGNGWKKNHARPTHVTESQRRFVERCLACEDSLDRVLEALHLGARQVAPWFLQSCFREYIEMRCGFVEK